MLTVAGGKLTTYRSVALETLDRLRGELGLGKLDRRPVPLPGAADAGSVATRIAARTGLPPATAAHLASYYGTLADDVVALADARPELLEPLHPDGPDIATQVVYAGRSEWATSVEDVVVRRTSLAHRGLATPEVVARVESLLQESLATRSTALTMPS
jgi:glycerol-3-phosphate dehydrogenase